MAAQPRPTTSKVNTAQTRATGHHRIDEMASTLGAFVLTLLVVIRALPVPLQPTRLQPEIFSILIIRHSLPPPLPPPIVGRPEPFEDDGSDSFAE